MNTQRKLRGHAFLPPQKELKKVPPLYYTQDQDDPMVWIHYFLGASDWYVTELDPETNTAFGWAVLNGDVEMAELGYISLPELETVRVSPGFVVERDMHWEPQPLSKIEAKHKERA